MALIQC